MRGQVKITRLQLNDKTDEKFAIIGLVSSEADYKLSLLLNSKLKISLKSNHTLDVKEDDGTSISFSRYSDSSGSPGIIYSLISNKSEKLFLVRKLRNIDYFFQVRFVGNEFDLENLTGTLREVEKITAVFKLDQDLIKDKNFVYLTF
jgi:hypothetical protein